ncbi:hypothetical protein [Tenacibaculum crassostreae]|uniref:hypothetical protein n=1 Tax=Tenacibaculum crassostreae TaxID=502683 RepID=UPI00389355E9
MKKQILNIGKVLGKEDQKNINGGSAALGFCDANGGCPSGYYCQDYFCHKNPSSGGGGGGTGSGGGCVPDRFCVDDNDTCCIG